MIEEIKRLFEVVNSIFSAIAKLPKWLIALWFFLLIAFIVLLVPSIAITMKLPSWLMPLWVLLIIGFIVLLVLSIGYFDSPKQTPTSVIEMPPSYLGNIQKIESLIKAKKCEVLSQSEFKSEVHRKKKEYLSKPKGRFEATFPITEAGIEYFMKLQKTESGENNEKIYFDDEVGMNVRRVAIVETDGDGHISSPIRDFLKDFKERMDQWKVITKRRLKTQDMYREFCIFSELKDDTKPYEDRLAYFTYLDYLYERIFTKGPWNQYRTTDPEYISELREIFNTMWKMADPIDHFLDNRG